MTKTTKLKLVASTTTTDDAQRRVLQMHAPCRQLWKSATRFPVEKLKSSGTTATLFCTITCETCQRNMLTANTIDPHTSPTSQNYLVVYMQSLEAEHVDNCGKLRQSSQSQESKG